MKISPIRLILFFAAAFMLSSCVKDSVPVQPLQRTIKFNLYTEKDFSAENGNITFSILIRDGSKTLLDSAIATMKVKDIPTLANKLAFEKKIFYNNTDLSVGFKYYLENVGYSWYFEILKAGQTNKDLNFSFK